MKALYVDPAAFWNGQLPQPGAWPVLHRLVHQLGLPLYWVGQPQAWPEIMHALLANDGLHGTWLAAWPEPVEGVALTAGPLPEVAPLGQALSLGNLHWAEVEERLHLPQRTAKLRRSTNETDIELELNLDGSGQSHIRTGLGFFDHMLDQLARHSGMDLHLTCRGDLHVDEHHSVEDTALALGEALRTALGNKHGLERYGFVAPMDESRASVSLDFSGRPWLVWEVHFTRERIGDVPTELFRHFFHSLADAARLTLHISAQGENEHHLIEGIFKATARALRMALHRTASGGVPSTKGSL